MGKVVIFLVCCVESVEIKQRDINPVNAERDGIDTVIRCFLGVAAAGSKNSAHGGNKQRKELLRQFHVYDHNLCSAKVSFRLNQ